MITPIAMTAVDWGQLFGPISAGLNRSISRGLDARNITTRGLAEMISAFGEFHTEGTDAIACQRLAGFLLKHISISFACVLTPLELRDFLISGKVSVLDCEDERLVIATANLEDWRTTVINLCSQNQTHQMRNLGARLLQALDKLGLEKIFSDYTRKVQKQGEMILASHK